MNAETTAMPPLIAAGGAPAAEGRFSRRHAASLKLVVISVLVLVFQLPLQYVDSLREERSKNQIHADQTSAEARSHVSRGSDEASRSTMTLAMAAREGYRIAGRSLKYNILVLALVFSAFFLFEVLVGLRMHAVHYVLVGAALCLFYLALLALGEVVTPGFAYWGAAIASSLLVVLYSMAILRSRGRASVIATLLGLVYGVLYVVLTMEDYALLTGTAVLFIVLGALMYFTRNIDWHAAGAEREAKA